ncbi:MAG: tRNA (adenosine(37)-N6)-threonylcarbamoyltransferase complex ATPase subunit type 1 TsaE [Solobacterium sp.]|nr:tRNA (adenosine(37)-N6)-threonylcarbamoyltransferase complex ATPase subunit type 1 TsaE [Solobacterium sp.]
MDTVSVITENASMTKELGVKIGALAKPDMVILLSGDLGAGKTTLTQGIAKGLGISRTVTSPTFTIQKLYRDGRLVLNHIDAYRLEGLNQDLGFEEYLYDGCLTVIEWAQFAPNLIPEEHLSISIHLLEDDRREFILQPVGETYKTFVEALL